MFRPMADDVTQVPGSFSIFGGTITSVSGYTSLLVTYAVIGPTPSHSAPFA